MFREGLQGKIFKLFLIVIAGAVFLFVVLDIFQLQLLWRTAQDNSDSQAKMIKEQSLESLEKSTEINLTQTARQAAFSKYQKNYYLILLVSSVFMILLVWVTAVLARTMSLLCSQTAMISILA